MGRFQPHTYINTIGLTGRNTDRKTWAQAHRTPGYLDALRMSGKKPPCCAREHSSVQGGCLNLRCMHCWQLQWRALSSRTEKEKKRAREPAISLSQLASNMTQLPLTWSPETTSSYMPPPLSPRFYPPGLIVCNSYQVRLQSAYAAPKSAVGQPSVCCQHFIGFQGGGLLFFSVILARQ